MQKLLIHQFKAKGERGNAQEYDVIFILYLV